MPTALTSLRACVHDADMTSSQEVMCLHRSDQATLQLQLKRQKSRRSLTLSPLSLFSPPYLTPSLFSSGSSFEKHTPRGGGGFNLLILAEDFATQTLQVQTGTTAGTVGHSMPRAQPEMVKTWVSIPRHSNQPHEEAGEIIKYCTRTPAGCLLVIEGSIHSCCQFSEQMQHAA